MFINDAQLRKPFISANGVPLIHRLGGPPAASTPSTINGPPSPQWEGKDKSQFHIKFRFVDTLDNDIIHRRWALRAPASNFDLSESRCVANRKRICANISLPIEGKVDASRKHKRPLSNIGEQTDEGIEIRANKSFS